MIVRLRSSLLLLFPLFLSGGCNLFQPPPEDVGLWQDAAAGVHNEGLAKLSKRYWESLLAADPIQATYVGDTRYHGRLPLRTVRWTEARSLELEEMRRRARVLKAAGLDSNDRITCEMLMEELDKELAQIEMDLGSWNVDPLEGPHVQLLKLARVQPHGNTRQREQLVKRWNRMGAYMRQHVKNLKRGKRNGMIASRTAVQKVIDQLGEMLSEDLFLSPLVRIADGGGRWYHKEKGQLISQIAFDELGDARLQETIRLVNLHLQESPTEAISTELLLPAQDDVLTIEERGLFLQAVLHAIRDDLRPALNNYRKFLEEEILPAARPDDRPGLAHIENGQSIYRRLIREHVSLPLKECDAKAIHEYGKQEVARIRSEIADLGERILGTRDVKFIQDRMREDAEMHFTTRDEVEAKAGEALYRAQAKMSEYFGILPKADCRVVRIPSYEERDTTIAYYNAPALDGSRPGQYFINTFAPETRPRYEAEVLAYHEAIPGHHLQISIANELDTIPLFRRHAGSTAFVEGWALYTERLSDEMGLYSTDLDRMGVLSFDAWRACRLVVDTGIHHFGWSRNKAIEYLYENTLLAKNNVVNEVDRYIAWPGQALAYKMGQREFLALRDKARETLGPRFSYPRFHDRVLQNGAISLPSLRGVITRWLDR